MDETKDGATIALPKPTPAPQDGPTEAEKAARKNGGGRMFSPRDIVKRCMELRHDEGAATAIEYGLIAALVAVAITASVKGIGSQLKATFNTVATTLQAA